MVVVEVLYLGNLMVPLFLIQSSAYRSRSRQVDELLASGVTDSPSVDIVVQATKQPMRLIRRALLSSLDLGCKPRSITVVDENCREEIRDLAQGLGAGYVVQSLPLSAADLHSSLSGSGAELIAAFDASCMPLKSFLTRTTALFRDKGVAMVQTPQALFHSEDYNRNLGAEVVMPPNRSYSSFFLQVLRDQRNAVLGSGGSAVVRRSALLELDLPLPLGAHQARQASLGLLSGSWRIAYLPEMLSICEAPRCFADYLDRKLQTIHADLLLIPTALSKATWGSLWTWQKGLILNHLADQFSPLFRVAYLVMPLVALTAGFSLVNASLLDFIGYGGPFLILLAAVPSWLTQQQRVQFWNGVQDALLAVPSLRGCWNLVLKPSQAFRPLMQDDRAPKNSSRWEGRSPKPQSVHLPLVWPFVVLIVQLCSTLTVRYLMPLLPIPLVLSLPSYTGEDLMLAWNLFNGVMITVCLLCSIDQPVLRNGARVGSHAAGGYHRIRLVSRPRQPPRHLRDRSWDQAGQGRGLAAAWREGLADSSGWRPEASRTDCPQLEGKDGHRHLRRTDVPSPGSFGDHKTASASLREWAGESCNSNGGFPWLDPQPSSWASAGTA
jgi:cellulose synthase (UDP-forming)